MMQRDTPSSQAQYAAETVKKLASAGTQKRDCSRFPSWAKVVIAICVLFIVMDGIGYWYYQANFAQSLDDITSQSAIREKEDESIVNPLTQRTNIVLLGSDTDGKGNDPNSGTPLAQTVIIVTIDPATRYVGMLSIPRDMQVSDAAYGYSNVKLDEVFEHAWTGANANERARTAAGHIMDVIGSNYGIHCDYYAWVGLQGFIKVIDEVGGVDVDVTHPMLDDLYPDDTNNAGGNKYDYMRLYLAPGPQHLNGQEALEYVRTRHADLGGDFGRTERQQQVLTQLKMKLSSTDSISKAPALLHDLDGYLMTDMSLATLAAIAQVAKGIDVNSIQRVALIPPLYASPGLPRNNFAPICSRVEPIIQQMFDTTAQCLPQTASSEVRTSTIARGNTPASTVPIANERFNRDTFSWSEEGYVSAGDLHALFDLLLFTVFGAFEAMQNVG